MSGSGPTVVQLDALCVLKIIKHCCKCAVCELHARFRARINPLICCGAPTVAENEPEIVTGHLLGLDTDTVLEVTHSFAFPNTKYADNHCVHVFFFFLLCLFQVVVHPNDCIACATSLLASVVAQRVVPRFICVSRQLCAVIRRHGALASLVVNQLSGALCFAVFGTSVSLQSPHRRVPVGPLLSNFFFSSCVFFSFAFAARTMPMKMPASSTNTK